MSTELEDDDRDVVDAVVERAVANLTSWCLAKVLDEPADTCEEWVDRAWNDLRDGLDEEQRLVAIVDLLMPAAKARAVGMMMSGGVTG